MVIYNLVGIGFGPSNISTAIFCEKFGLDNTLFLEKKSEFSWHPSMLLDTSQLQIMFLKDLVSIEDPTSRYTFVNYLKEQGRLNQFINLRKFFPDRIEFAQYYKWTASQFDNVLYNSEVKSITYEKIDGEEIIKICYVNTLSNETIEIFAKNIIVADGGTKYIPKDVKESKRVFHTDNCLERLEQEFPDYRSKNHIAVVGSGQSAVDVLTYLTSRYPNLKISSYIRKFAFKPQDDSHFVNELFFPENAELWYDLSQDMKDDLYNLHKDVTHSASDIDMLPGLYNSIYMDKATGKNRFSLNRFHQLNYSNTLNNKVEARFFDKVQQTEVNLEFDALILATGYEHSLPVPLLKSLDKYLLHKNTYMFSKDYSLIPSDSNFHPKIFLPGYAEKSHGFSETLASLMATRSSKIVQVIKNNLHKQESNLCI